MNFKLYSLVSVSEPRDDVQGGVHRYIGEIMSMLTPTGTYMVRRVPGFAGTLVELPASYLTPSPFRSAVVHVAEVEGPGAFPTDMLRRDSCVPVNFTLDEDDRAQLIPGLGDKLLVARCRTDWNNSFTVARWNSFGWQVNVVHVECVREPAR